GEVRERCGHPPSRLGSHLENSAPQGDRRNVIPCDAQEEDWSMRPHEEITNEEQHEPAHAPGLRDMTPIPGSIVKAVCSVMAASAAVNKSQKNQHGGYMFASTDDIYAAVTRKMGEAGLICLCLEETPPKLERFEKEEKISQWMNISYTFVLATADATWTDKRSRR